MPLLLEIQGLAVTLRSDRGQMKLVDDVCFSVHSGETYALVGESGCGKSITSLSILGLLPEPHLSVSAGSIVFEGRNLIDLPESDMREIRGSKIGTVFQDPMTSLNPVLTVGEQIVEGLRAHQPISLRDARREAARLLKRVRIPDAESRLGDFPHRLSGGMRQRVMIAIAMAGRPRLLIADEPTTALDVTVQAEILRLMHEMQEEIGTAIILITHNMGIVAQYADRVGIMYAGRIVETGKVDDIFDSPMHPYSRGLLSCIPAFVHGDPGKISLLPDIPGSVPEPGARPGGCAFAPRCASAMPVCTERLPEFVPDNSVRRVACFAATGLGSRQPVLDATP